MLESTNKSSGEDPIEQLLSSFAPAPVEIDRDQLMFQAGMRAAQAAAEVPTLTLRARLWPALAMVSTAAAVILGIVVWQRPERVIVVERPADVTLAMKSAPQPSSESVTAPDSLSYSSPTIDAVPNYVHRRDSILRDGAESFPSDLPGDSYVARAIPTQRELLKELPGELQQRYQVDSDRWWQSWLISGDRL